MNAVFSPAPLARADVGLSFSVGLLGNEGLVLFRPSVLLAPHLALEGFVGETVGQHVDVIYYGAVANLYLWPGLAGDAVLRPGRRRGARPREGRPAGDRHRPLPCANVGGGLLLAFKKRVTLRLDFRNYSVFDADYTRNLQEYSGGLAIFF